MSQFREIQLARVSAIETSPSYQMGRLLSLRSRFLPQERI